jgi:aryl-alcohol dehydrogenase-like predicted oxidoreductase
VLGTSGFRDYDTAAAILDAWFEAGCNTLDTAWIYGVHRGDLPAETIVGRWIRTRGVEADVVVFGKAAHPPECRPECLPAQVKQSLDRLGLARMHMVQAHRDDTSIPVGEWAEALIALVDCGLAASYGVSNWTIERLQAIYEYADARQQLRPAGVSDQLSLAEMVIPIYEGCVSLRGQDQRRWLTETDTLLIPWASQGRGVFTVDEAELASGWLSRSWYSPANVRRMNRANELAQSLGVEPINVALAWVLHQPFPCLPVIGPQSPAEIASSLAALDVQLDQEELAWLDMDDRR